MIFLKVRQNILICIFQAYFDKGCIMEKNPHQAILPVYKSLRFRHFKKNDKFLATSLRPVSKADTGIFFPFERTVDKVADGVKMIFGNMYPMYAFLHYVPKYIKVKEMMFRKTNVMIENAQKPVPEELKDLKVKKSVFYKRIERNYIWDMSDVMRQVFPEFNEVKKWSSPLAFRNIDNFILEWMRFNLVNPIDPEAVAIKTSVYRHGEGMKSYFKRFIMGIRIDTRDRSILRFINPIIPIPRPQKVQMNNYIVTLLMRTIIAGRIGYKGNDVINELWEMIKDMTIVFYNNRGRGFIYNTSEDINVMGLQGNSIISRLKMLLGMTISSNDPEVDYEEEGDIVDDSKVDDDIPEEGPVKVMVTPAGATLNNDVEKSDIPNGSDAALDEEKAEIERTIKMLCNSPIVKKAIRNKTKKLDKKIAAQATDNDPEYDEEDYLEDLEKMFLKRKVKPEAKVADVDVKNTKSGTVMKAAMNNDDDLYDGVDEDDDDDEVEDIEEDTNPDEIVDEDLDDIVGEDTDEIDDLDDVDLKTIITSVDTASKPKKTKAQLQREKIVKEKYKSIKVDNRTIEEIINDTQAKVIEDTTHEVAVKDKGVVGSKLIDFEKSYIKNTMQHDIIKAIKSFSDDKEVGLNIVSLDKTDTSNALDMKETYQMKFVDDNGRRHALKIDVPKVDKDGYLFMGGNKKILKKQLTLLPVVKTKPDKVMLSSNYNKYFIQRYGEILTRNMSVLNKIISLSMKNSRFRIFNGDNSAINSDFLTTIEYDVLAKKYSRFELCGANKVVNKLYIFDQKALRALIVKREMKYSAGTSKLPVGIDMINNEVIDVDLNNPDKKVSDLILNDIREMNLVPDYDEIVSKMAMPRRRMCTKILFISKEYVMISFLGVLFKLSEVINKEKIQVEFSDKRIPNDKRLSIKFSDGFLYYSDTNPAATLLMNGLSYMNTDEYTFADFDTETPYIDYFFTVAKSRNVLKGMIVSKELFIDNITKEVLTDLSLPTDFLELFLYANSLLADNVYTNETDMSNYRLRGYEIVPALLYKIIGDQFKQFRQNVSMARINLQQEQLFTKLNKCFILENYDSTNPLNDLKIKSIVTMKGPGGVNEDRAYTLEKRAYNMSAIGTIAISSVEGGGVGINKQLTKNPKILSTRGYFETCKSRAEASKKTLAEIASPEEAYNAFANLHDDPKRIGIGSVQAKHIIGVKHANPPVVSSGIDSVLVYETGDTYAPKAKGKGVIVDVTNESIAVKYEDGSTESIQLDLSIQRNSNHFNINRIVPNVKKGQKVDSGDVLAYAAEFFKPDVFGRIRSSIGVLAKLLLHDRVTTDDDSGVITESLAKKLQTSLVDRKQIVLSKNVNLLSYKQIGDDIISGDPIMTFEEVEDSTASQLLDSLGDASEEMMAFARQTPKSHSTGKIVDMRVYYTDPVDEYSDSLNNLIHAYSKMIRQKIKYRKSVGMDTSDLEVLLRPTVPKRTGADARINGALIPDASGILIEYFIESPKDMGVGDKMRFGSCIKSVVAQIIPTGQEPITDDGVVLDGVISTLSITARMAYSPYMSGVLTHILVEESKKIAKEYLESL